MLIKGRKVVQKEFFLQLLLQEIGEPTFQQFRKEGAGDVCIIVYHVSEKLLSRVHATLCHGRSVCNQFSFLGV